MKMIINKKVIKAKQIFTKNAFYKSHFFATIHMTLNFFKIKTNILNIVKILGWAN